MGAVSEGGREWVVVWCECEGAVVVWDGSVDGLLDRLMGLRCTPALTNANATPYHAPQTISIDRWMDPINSPSMNQPHPDQSIQ